MTDEMEKVINKMCGLLLIKCFEEETDEIGLNVDYENRGLKGKLECNFKILDFKEE